VAPISSIRWIAECGALEEVDAPESMLRADFVDSIGAGDDEVWLGTYGNGIIAVDVARLRTRRIRHDPTVDATVRSPTFPFGLWYVAMGCIAFWANRREPGAGHRFVAIKLWSLPVLTVGFAAAHGLLDGGAYGLPSIS